MANRLLDHGCLDKVSMRREDGGGWAAEYIGHGLSRVSGVNGGSATTRFSSRCFQVLT